jgi:hypothetical protein
MSSSSSTPSSVAFPELAALEAAERVLSQTHANNCGARDELARSHAVSAKQVEAKREELKKLESTLSAFAGSMETARARAEADNDKLTKLRATIAAAKRASAPRCPESKESQDGGGGGGGGRRRGGGGESSKEKGV